MRAKLNEARDSFATVDGISAEALARIEARLLPQLAQAQRDAETVAVALPLRFLLDPDSDVRARWDAAPLAARRAVGP